MQYLTRWRLAQAAQLLRAGSGGIAQIAECSGYLSEAAFTRAFKREFGIPPAAWRRNGGHDYRFPPSIATQSIDSYFY